MDSRVRGNDKDAESEILNRVPSWERRVESAELGRSDDTGNIALTGRLYFEYGGFFTRPSLQRVFRSVIRNGVSRHRIAPTKPHPDATFLEQFSNISSARLETTPILDVLRHHGSHAQHAV